MGLNVSQEAEAAPGNEELAVELRESHDAGGRDLLRRTRRTSCDWSKEVCETDV